MTDQGHSAVHASDAESFYDKYLVHDAREIRRHLERLLEGRCTLLGHVEGGSASTVTVLLHLDESAYRVDVPRSPEDQRTWSSSAKLFFEGSLDRVALRFHSGPAGSCSTTGARPSSCRCPRGMLHLQRREFLRLEPPIDAVRLPRPGAATWRGRRLDRRHHPRHRRWRTGRSRAKRRRHVRRGRRDQRLRDRAARLRSAGRRPLRPPCGRAPPPRQGCVAGRMRVRRPAARARRTGCSAT